MSSSLFCLLFDHNSFRWIIGNLQWVQPIVRCLVPNNILMLPVGLLLSHCHISLQSILKWWFAASLLHAVCESAVYNIKFTSIFVSRSRIDPVRIRTHFLHTSYLISSHIMQPQTLITAQMSPDFQFYVLLCYPSPDGWIQILFVPFRTLNRQ